MKLLLVCVQCDSRIDLPSGTLSIKEVRKFVRSLLSFLRAHKNHSLCCVEKEDYETI